MKNAVLTETALQSRNSTETVKMGKVFVVYKQITKFSLGKYYRILIIGYYPTIQLAAIIIQVMK